MFHGHHGAALLLCGYMKLPLPLWVLFLLSQLQDLILLLLVHILHIEQVFKMSVPDNFINQFKLVYVPYSHGLVFSILYSLLAYILFRTPKAKLAAAFAIISHWILDFITHVPDLDICFPFMDCGKAGLKLWLYLWPSVVVECGICILGAAVYFFNCVSFSQRGKTLARLIPVVVLMIAMTIAMPFVEAPEETAWSVGLQMYGIYAMFAVFAWLIEKTANVTTGTTISTDGSHQTSGHKHTHPHES